MIKAVIIDIDNTLLDFDKSSNKAIELAHKSQNLEFNDKILQEFLKITSKFWAKIEKGEITRETLYKNRWKEIYANLKIDADGPTTETLYRKLLYDCAFTIDGASEILEYLSKKYVVCVASNAPYNQQVARLKKIGFDKYINHVFISEEIGSDKPNAKFFDVCFSRLSPILPAESVIIGDSLSADILGGKNYGLKTCWFDLKNTLDDRGINPDWTINKLIEIKNIL